MSITPLVSSRGSADIAVPEIWPFVREGLHLDEDRRQIASGVAQGRVDASIGTGSTASISTDSAATLESASAAESAGEGK